LFGVQKAFPPAVSFLSLFMNGGNILLWSAFLSKAIHKNKNKTK
jgi:hypothetical protein